MTNYTSVWSELRDHYRRRRPVDLWSGVPLLTEDDVTALARRWGRALDDHARDLGTAHASLVRWWRDQRERLARATSLERVRQFWRVSFDLARELSYQLGRASRRGVRNAAPPTDDGAGLVRFQGMKDWAEMYTALKLFFRERRGTEVAPGGRKWPKTTNDDVRQLAAMWTKAANGARTDVMGVKGAVAAWREVAAEVERLTAAAEPTAVYAKNWEFWYAAKTLAIRIQVAAEEPPDITFTDALIKSVKNLPDTLGDAFGAAGGAVKDVAEGAADVAGDVVAKVGKPLLIGAGIVGAAAVGVALLRR